MAKKSNSNVFAIQITIALFILVFIVVMILSTKDKEKKEESDLWGKGKKASVYAAILAAERGSRNDEDEEEN